MAKNKTTETNDSVAAYLATIKDEKRRTDFSTVIEMLKKLSGFEPKMWGTAIVGFGSYHYKYDTGREGDAALLSIACRSNAITFYLGTEFEKREELIAKLGKHKTSGGCIHVQQLADINTDILLKMTKNSILYKKSHYPG